MRGGLHFLRIGVGFGQNLFQYEHVAINVLLTLSVGHLGEERLWYNKGKVVGGRVNAEVEQPLRYIKSSNSGLVMNLLQAETSFMLARSCSSIRQVYSFNVFQFMNEVVSVQNRELSYLLQSLGTQCKNVGSASYEQTHIPVESPHFSYGVFDVIVEEVSLSLFADDWNREKIG